LVKITLRAGPVAEQTVGVESAIGAQLPAFAGLPPSPAGSLEDPHAANASVELIRIPRDLVVTALW
jgi:hypothetical protein